MVVLWRNCSDGSSRGARDVERHCFYADRQGTQRQVRTGVWENKR